jgi:integrase
MCRHIQLKANTWYYRRRIPDDCQDLHRDPVSRKKQTQLFFSLKTTDKTEASKRANSHTLRLDATWKAYREGNASPKVSLAQLEAAGLSPGDGTLHGDLPPVTEFIDEIMGRYDQFEERPEPRPQDKLTLDILMSGKVPRTLSDARDKHIELGKLSKEPKQIQQYERAWGILMGITGDIPLDQLRREHANQFVKKVISQGKGLNGNGPATVERYLKQISPVITTAIRELELPITNPFLGVVIPNKDEGQRKPRESFSSSELIAIQAKCREVNDQRRWAIAMLSDSGARLAEVIGLRKCDVMLDAPVPHIIIKAHEGRRLKTIASTRKVPLVGEALWAAQQAISTDGDLLFPVFAPKRPSDPVNAASASAALNKWLKEQGLVGEGQTLHSFRHAVRDRLRDTGAPIDVADAIGGWARQSVGDGYGKGHSLEVLQQHLGRIVIAASGDR